MAEGVTEALPVAEREDSQEGVETPLTEEAPLAEAQLEEEYKAVPDTEAVPLPLTRPDHVPEPLFETETLAVEEREAREDAELEALANALLVLEAERVTDGVPDTLLLGLNVVLPLFSNRGEGVENCDGVEREDGESQEDVALTLAHRETVGEAQEEVD